MPALAGLRKLGFHVHRPEIWAADFFTARTVWFHSLYVFFLRTAGLPATENPSAAKASELLSTVEQCSRFVDVQMSVEPQQHVCLGEVR